MSEKITIKAGSFATGKRDRDAPKRRRRLLIMVLVCNLLGNVMATQYVAHMLHYDASLGAGISISEDVKIYQPYAWLSWCISLMRSYGLKHPMVGKLVGGSALIILLMTFAPGIMNKKKEKDRREREKLEAVHGSARWADIEDIRDCGLLPPKGQTKTGVYVGGFKDPKTNRIIYLKHDGPEHILAFAPTRSGKGVGLVLPSLLNWPNSCIVLDIKGENYSLTSGWRQQNAGKDGSYILKFDPLDTTGTCARYNPLNEIRLGTPNEHADIENLSMMLADPTGKGAEGDNAHWVNTSSSLLICLIYHMLYTCRIDGTEPTLEKLRSLFTAPGESQENDEKTEEQTNDFKERVLKPIMSFVHNPDVDVSNMSEEEIRRRCATTDALGAPKIPELYEWHKNGKPYYTRFRFPGDDGVTPLRTHPKAAENANEAYQRGDKEGATVLSTAANALKLYADPTISKNLKNATFKLYDLMNADKPVSLYLCVPPAQLSRLIPIMRIMVTQVVTILADRLRYEKGQTKGMFQHKMLLLLDEFPTLGNMEIFETSLAFIAGYGLKAYLIIQDLKQLYKRYSKEESVQSNCHVQIMYAPNNVDTAKTISEMLGNQTIVLENKSSSVSKGVRTVSTSLAAQSRPLMPVDEVMQMEGPKKDASGMIKEPGEMLVKVAGFPPIRGRQILYFLDPTFSERSQYAAAKKSDVLMKDMVRTYVRPKYAWITDEEYKHQKDDDSAGIRRLHDRHESFYKDKIPEYEDWLRSTYRADERPLKDEKKDDGAKDAEASAEAREKEINELADTAPNESRYEGDGKDEKEEASAARPAVVPAQVAVEAQEESDTHASEDMSADKETGGSGVTAISLGGDRSAMTKHLFAGMAAEAENDDTETSDEEDEEHIDRI